MELTFPPANRGDSQALAEFLASDDRPFHVEDLGYGILRSDWGTGVTTPVAWEDGP